MPFKASLNKLSAVWSFMIISRPMPFSLVHLALLCAVAFLAGFVDAIVGGGGLIQTPASLIILPALPVSNVIASLKLPSLSGTTVASVQYIKRVRINWPLVAVVCAVAFFASFAGSQLLTVINNAFMKPVLLFVLCAVAVYTYTRKNFGQKEQHVPLSASGEYIRAVIISLVVGFYDGFIGPGAGSFFILAFISMLGFDFLKASANAKLANMATNLGSITLFLIRGKILWTLAIPMALCNSLGGAVGANLAIAKGNKFIRTFFLFIVVGTLLRFMYDIFVKR